MKRDGRSFDHRTLEVIRLMAVERVRAGELASFVIASYGFNRTTIYKWVKAASQPGIGLKALRAKPATGRPRSLTPRQEQQVFRWVNGKDPRQYGLDFGLWTRSVVADLIERKFDSAWADCRGRITRQAGTDAAKTFATCLSARSGSDREMAARDFSKHRREGEGGWGRSLFLG